MSLACSTLRAPTAAATRFSGTRLSSTARPVVRTNRRSVAPVRATTEDAEDIGTVGLAAGVAGLIASPVCIWSAYTLKTTGAGLPPGPGGALGALEGVSYLVVLGLVGWSAATKVKTGTGLPAGPSGLLGGAEGLAYLALLAAIAAFGANAAGL